MMLSTRAAVAVALIALAASGARAEDVVLENVVFTRGGWTITAPRLEIDGSSLSRDQVASLLSAATPDPKLLRDLKADRIVAPQLVATRDGGAITIHNAKAAGVAAGRVRQASFDSLDGTGRSAAGVGRVALRTGAASAQDADLNRLIDVAAGADLGAASLPAAALSWNDVVATFFTGGASGGDTESFTLKLASFKTQNVFDGDVPAKGSGEAKGLVFQAPAGSAMGQGLKSFGFDAVNADIVFSGAYDKAAKRFDLTDYRFTTQGAGSLSLAGRLEGVEPALFTGSPEAKRAAVMKAALAVVTARFEDGGLVAKASDYFALQTKKSAADVRAEWSAVASSLIPLLLNGAPSATAVAAAVSRFITAPTSLTVTAKAKNGAAPIAALRDLRGPQVLSLIDLSATTGP